MTSTGCGLTKGCFGSPTSCIDDDATNCEFFVSWNTEQDGSNVFTMTGTASGTYIALGFSKSQSMVKETKTKAKNRQTNKVKMKKKERKKTAGQGSLLSHIFL